MSARRRARPASPDTTAISYPQAAVLGLLQGPAELLPVSSSAHVALIPWLLGWSYSELDPELRKSFEVALHLGTAAALLISLNDEVVEAVRDFDRRRAGLVVGSLLPPALAGYRYERLIERRLGTPGSIAAGLVAGSVAMALVDRRPATRRQGEAGAMDGLALGLAQACALVPGVSRNGATLVAARARGFGRAEANALSRYVALPVILGAGGFKGLRLRRRLAGEAAEALPAGTASALAVGGAAAFVSTLAFTWVIRHVERGRSLAPYGAYRGALAGLVTWRLRQSGRTDGARR